MTFYTVADLQGMLKLSKSQVYALIEGGELRCHRFTRKRNGGIRVSQAQLEEYLRATEAGPTPAPAPAPEPAATPRHRGDFAFLPPRP
jgi:excisionase family DNA binding protein